MSFHLVDRIHEFTPQKSAAGTLEVPTDAEDFPLSLVVEALGQLAAYVAMENADFALRPVAAVAGEVVAHRDIRGGDQLDLSIEVGALRRGAMRYGGMAHVDGSLAVELRRCTGAMLPMEAFDDPASVRAHLQMLRDGGAPRRTFPSRAEFAPRVLQERSDNGRSTSTFEAPQHASFYADHFPRRPVYPATLLLDAKIRVAQRLIAETHPTATGLPTIGAVRGVKVRAFTPPGGRVDVVVEETGTAQDGSEREVRMEAFADGTRVSTAIVLLHLHPAAQ